MGIEVFDGLYIYIYIDLIGNTYYIFYKGRQKEKLTL